MGQKLVRAGLRREWIWVAAAAAGLVVCGYHTLARPFAASDYVYEARPAVDALLSGHVGAFLQRAPVYGGSLLLRAPLMLLAHALGGSAVWIYRASVIPALLAGGALGVWLATTIGRTKAAWVTGLVVVGLCVVNPIAMNAVLWGHPEDLLGAVLCVAAVLCASYDRPIWAGAVLGAAIANKEWALLAVGPVLVALPHRRLLSLTCAATVAVAIMSPFVIGGKLSLSHGLQGLPAATTGVIFTPWQVWWFFGSPWQGPYGGRVAPGWIPGLAHPLIVGITIPLTLLYVHQLRRRRGGTPDGLLLLAFLLLLRCMLDPWDFSYYATPFLIALTAWETLRFKRIPVVAVIASFVAWILYVKIPQHFSLDRQALSFLLVSCAATAAMALSLYAPGVRQLLAGPRGQRSNVEPPLEAG